MDIKIVAKYSHVIITGDFNYPDIDWTTVTSTKSQEHESQIFINAMRDSFLYQHITQPTRHRYNQCANTLDLVISNEPDMIPDIQYLPGLGLSDHLCIVFSICTYTPQLVEPPSRFCYHKGNYSSLRLTGMNSLMA